MNILIGIHPVREALVADKPLDRVLIAKGAGGPRLQEIIDLCRKRNIQVRFEDRRQIERVAQGASHQGVAAFGSASKYEDAGDLLESAEMLVALDGIEDPHNLGAILRTVDAAGASGVVIPERRAVGLTPVAAKASAGAVASVKVARVVNLSRWLDETKERGFWIYGLDERGTQNYDEVEYTSPAVLVLGREGKGLHEHVRKRCDFLVRIPLAGQVSSLNVSVACGVVLFEWRRRREAGDRTIEDQSAPTGT